MSYAQDLTVFLGGGAQSLMSYAQDPAVILRGAAVFDELCPGPYGGPGGRGIFL